jgi:hypothetical protein
LTDGPGPPDGAGARNVESVVFMGTPHGGAVSLLEFFSTGYGFLYKGQLIHGDEILTMPSSYQLLPHPRQDCFLDGTDESKGLTPYRDDGGLPINLYDSQTWIRMGWLPETWLDGPRRRFFENGLERGLLWWTALDARWEPPAHLRVLNVGGASTSTPGRAVLVDKPGGGRAIEFDIPWNVDDRSAELVRRRIVTLGDGRVTLESAFDIPYGMRVVSLSEHDFVHHDPAVFANVIAFILGNQILGSLRQDLTLSGGGLVNPSLR